MLAATPSIFTRLDSLILSVEAADKTCIMAEIAPRFNPNSGTKINKTIAQQNHVADGEAIEQHFNWEIVPVVSHHVDADTRDFQQDD